MLLAPLVTGVRSILMEGSPVYPRLLRFAEVLQREGATIFKSGSAMMRQVQADPEASQELAGMEFPHLRMGTFCAEPVTLAVHEFAARVLTPNFINSYWATEHGGIVFTRSLEESRPSPPPPDTKVFPLPWIEAGIAKLDREDEEACTGERDLLGDILIQRPYPYLARTIFGDAAHAKCDSWRGDRKSVV